MPRREESQTSEGRRRGNPLGIWFFKLTLRVLGLRAAYGLLHLVCLHYVIFDRSTVLRALPYIKRRFDDRGLFWNYFHVYRLFVSQGQQLIDRYAIISEAERFEIEIKGRERFLNLMSDSRAAAVLLTAHVGNWQGVMTQLQIVNRAVYLLMRQEENPAVDSSLRVTRDQGNIRIISPEAEYLGGVIQIMSLLRKGEIVSIMGDRDYGSDSIEVTFLGEKARFPYSAFAFAAAAGCPLIVLLSAKVSVHRYVVDATNIFYPTYEGKRDRPQQLQHWVQQFVTVLETYTEQYPYQCFLFHDVWSGKNP